MIEAPYLRFRRVCQGAPGSPGKIISCNRFDQIFPNYMFFIN